MRIIEGLPESLSIENAVVTIGTFDGVHLGHQEILTTVMNEAKKRQGESVLFTFDPHPRTILFPKQEPLKLIQTREEKLKKLASIGIENVVIYPFTEDFAKWPAKAFVEKILIKGLKAKQIIIGYDHQFGKDREGNLTFLKNYADKGFFELKEIPAEQIDEVSISSSKIRNALLSGDVSMANSYLGAPFELGGVIKKGLQNGRKIGFPTANIQLQNQQKIIPADGVYAVRFTCLERVHLGMMNIGWRPTIDEIKTERKLEVNLFDFDDDIYDQFGRIELIKYIRPEQKFANLESLKNQLSSDEKTIRTYFSSALFV